MIADNTYKLAYRVLKNWNEGALKEFELVGVKVDEEYLYISLLSDFNALILNIFIGEDGLQGFRNMLIPVGKETYTQHSDLDFIQNVLTVEYTQLKNLPEAQRQRVLEFLSKQKMKLPENEYVPFFFQFKNNEVNWNIENRKLKKYLNEALRAVIEVQKRLKQFDKLNLGFNGTYMGRGVIPALERHKGYYSWTRKVLPKYSKEIELTKPVFKNDVQIAKLRKIPKSSIFSYELIMLPEPYSDPEDLCPYFPYALLGVENETGFIFNMNLTKDYKTEADDLLKRVVDKFIKQQYLPRKIEVRNKTTYYFLEDLCKKAGIELEIVEEIPILDEIEYELETEIKEPNFDEIGNFVKYLEEISNSDTDAYVKILLDDIKNSFEGDTADLFLDDQQTFEDILSEIPTPQTEKGIEIDFKKKKKEYDKEDEK